MDAFLSYRSDDSALARRLAEDLQHAGLTVWLANKAILPGTDWAREIEQAISKARNILFLLPEKKEAASSWQASEIALAVASQRSDPKKRIIPVLAHPRTISEIPFFLNRFQTADMSSEDAYKKTLSKLVQLLRTEPQAELHEASDRVRKELISVQTKVIRHQEQQLTQATKVATVSLAVSLLSAVVTAVAAVVGALGALSWIGEKTVTTLLATIIGATVALAAPLIQRRLKEVFSIVLDRNHEVER
jgi:hypothetical protein